MRTQLWQLRITLGHFMNHKSWYFCGAQSHDAEGIRQKRDGFVCQLTSPNMYEDTLLSPFPEKYLIYG